MKSSKDELLPDEAVGTATVETKLPGGRVEVEYRPLDAVRADETPVVVLRSKGAASLVEWQDDAGVHRNWLPVKVITHRGDETFVKDPAMGIPEGVDFADAIKGKVSPKEIDQALKRAGIWTWADVLANPAIVVGVVTDTVGVANALLATAREEAKHG